MREIKFRAWDGENIIPHEKVVVYLGHGFIERETLDCNAIHIDKEVESLMQYTGLKDVNGVEIYEGDIVDYDGEWVDYVEFDEGYFWLASKRALARCDLNIVCLEVIGNVHENPELLES